MTKPTSMSTEIPSKVNHQSYTYQLWVNEFLKLKNDFLKKLEVGIENEVDSAFLNFGLRMKFLQYYQFLS